ncbi:MAG: type II toxin-antitoxin system PemK/MazF family toxin [Solirubrobacteraceae bacterium]
MIKRGEVWWGDLGDPRGSEPGYIRPVLIVSDDRYNSSRLRTVTIVVMSTNTRLAELPGNVFVPSGVSGLPHDSVANVTQIATVDRKALTDRVGHLPDWLLEQVADGIRLALML